jgi:heavy metal sensor kinase
VTMRLGPRHVRTRLTLWYAAVLTGVLVLFACVTLALLYFSLRRELDALLHAQYEEAEEHLHHGVYDRARSDDKGGPRELRERVEVWSTGGELLYRSPRMGEEALGDPPTGTTRMSPVTRRLRDGTVLRVLNGLERSGEARVLLRVALSENAMLHQWHRLLLGFLLGLPAAVTVAGIGGHWLALRALSPLDRMARQAEGLTAESLGSRLTIDNPEDELGHLARVFNLSLARIEESFAQLRRFTADASHELRTPLTAIRAVGEVALQGDQSPARYREAIGSMLEEVDRLSRLVETLLLLSRADAGVEIQRQDLGLFEWVRDTALLLEALAEEKAQRIDVQGDPSIRLEANPLLVRQAFTNLIDNAVKYAPRESVISIVVRRNGDAEAVVDVTDQGPGIAPEHASHVFDRFYRVDDARSRDDGGAGLGLSIARWAVEVHGGRIQLRSEIGKGSTFSVVLPARSHRV